MARKRGFLAELQHQSKVAARNAQQANNARLREQQAAARKVEQARKAEERAQAQAARAAEADRKRLEKEAVAAHVAAMQAEVDALNEALTATYDEVDSLLAATLDVDDYVDLDTLRRAAEHPPFDRPDLETPGSGPERIVPPPEPVYAAPEPPSKLGGLFGKKKHAELVAAAEAAHAEALSAWQAEVDQVPARQAAADAEHAESEARRTAELDLERARYERECEEREAEVDEHNAAIDTLATNLGYGTADAVEEYVSIVLANAVYPDAFPVEADFEFEASTAELRLRALVPGPDSVPDIKAYKYTRSSDEITTTALSQKAQKDRYNGAVHQVALRLLHEVFEADRRGLIKTISLEVGSDTADPATGNRTYIPFVAVGADRDTFMSFDLAAVVPTATLEHLGAAISKNPLGLVAVDSSGIRKS